MSTTLNQTLTQRVTNLIDETNQSHADAIAAPWSFEVTDDVHTVGITSSATSKTLRVNACWLSSLTENVEELEGEISLWYALHDAGLIA
jgi:hypothetical protein